MLRSPDPGVEILGPALERTLLVDGWSVPFINAIEVDGGRVHFVLDHRFGFDVSAADFDQVARLVANAISIALGLPRHPAGDLSDEERARLFAGVVHRALAPTRMIGITGVQSEDVDDEGEAQR